jgi:hypothetical protein
MEPQHENPIHPTGGDFLNRPHESSLHPILHPLTLARLYSEHHEQFAASAPRQALALAEQFCRQAQVGGIDTHTDAGFDWVLTPSRFSKLITLELGKGGFATLVQVEPGITAGQLDATLHAGVLGHQGLAQAYITLPDDQRAGLLLELRQSIEQVQANRDAAEQLQALRAQPELPQPAPRLQHLDIAGILQRYEVPKDQAMATEQHLLATHGGRLSSMHGSEILDAAHAHCQHPGLFGAHWQTWLCEVVSMGNGRAMEACLRMAADPDVPNARGDTALHIAARQGQDGFIRRLLEMGADPSLGNPQGQAPLHLAAEHMHAEACLALVAGGADPGQFDSGGRKPGDMHRGREKGREQAIGL